MLASSRINRHNLAGLMEVAPWARQGEILQIGTTTLALWDDVFDVKSGALEALVHQAILAPAMGAHPNPARHFFWNAHYGRLPKICNASPRTSANRSLNSTSASSSSRSDSCKSPSLLRSMSSWRRWSAFDGNRRFPTDSIQSTGAAIVEFT
ncbi:hypothetical protein SBV1_2760007 [Verrucomicrobia bacterium]|nr:hypothetical protein SBV1_2760007 [Verrucomicrobiota bacterium]